MKYRNYNDLDWNALFYYDETSPSFLRWKIDIFAGKDHKILKIPAHSIAGYIQTGQYYRVRYQRRAFQVHRIIFKMYNPDEDIEGFVIDHVDGNITNNSIENLRKIAPELNSRNAKICRKNKTGVSGVSYRYYITKFGKIKKFECRVSLLNGEVKTKSFSSAKYGEELAFKLACEWREKMIAELNEQGAGYTERHGT